MLVSRVVPAVPQHANDSKIRWRFQFGGAECLGCATPLFAAFIAKKAEREHFGRGVIGEPFRNRAQQWIVHFRITARRTDHCYCVLLYSSAALTNSLTSLRSASVRCFSWESLLDVFYNYLTCNPCRCPVRPFQIEKNMLHIPTDYTLDSG